MDKIKIKIYYITLIYFSVVYYISSFIYDSMIISFIKEATIIFLFILLFKKIINKVTLISKYIIFCYICFIFIATLNSKSLIGCIIDYKYYLVWPMMIFITNVLVNSDLEKIKLLTTIQIINLIIAILGFIFKITHNEIFLYGRFGEKSIAIKSILPTHFDFGMLMGLNIFITYLLITRYKQKYLISYLTIILSSIGVFFSYSRTSYVFYLIIIIYMIFNLISRNIKNKFLNMSIIINMFILGIISLIFFSNKILNMKIFSAESLMMRINDTWKNIKVKNVFFGDGLGVIGSNKYNFNTNYPVADNMFNRISINIGIAGIIIITIIIITALIRYKNKDLFVIVFACLISGIFGDIFTLVPFMIYLYCIIGILISGGKDIECINTI